MKNYRLAKKSIDVSVGESVRIIRELQELSQNDLAELAGIPQSTISAIENDRIQLGSLAEFDIDGSGGSDFGIGQGIIISDGTTQHCARITDETSGTSNQIEFTPDLPTVGLATSDFTLASIRVVPAVVYEVDANGLRRNNMLMSDEVEDLQVEYGLDINGDDVVDTSDPNEFPIDSLVGSDPSQIRTLRITGTTRTSQQDPEFNGPGFEAAANRPSTANDGRRRRRFVASVLPRNLL
jgi:DNA-binding XRE family transcriptional regulator